MTDQQINAAIAEIQRFPDMYWVKDYCNDLNAMHEAEKYLDTDELFRGYYFALCDITRSTRWPVHATARQRAEAFLRTLGKWDEAK